METSPILFLDSGVGGLPYLELGRQVLPQKNFIYLADTAHFPYGPKSDSELRSLIRVVNRKPPNQTSTKSHRLFVTDKAARARYQLAAEYYGLQFGGLLD
jgi:glutamate racemase